MPLTATAGALSYQKDSVRLPVPVIAQNEVRADGVIYKYAPSGQVLWVARLTSGVDMTVVRTATDSTGAVYGVGSSTPSRNGSVAFFYNADGSYAAQVPFTIPTQYTFLVKYNASGVYQWAAYVVGGSARGGAIAVDSSDNIFITGGISGVAGTTVTAYNANRTPFATTFSASNSEAFLARYNSSGAVAWMARVSTSTADYGQGIAVDSTGVYMTGSTNTGTTTAYNANGTAFATTFTSAGLTDAMVVKYTLEGSVLWLARIAGSRNDQGVNVAVDSAGNLYVTGGWGDQSTATSITPYNANGTAFGTTLSTNSSGNNTFLVKYNTAGTVQWAAKVLSEGGIGSGITIDSGNNIYIVGRANRFEAYNSNDTTFGGNINDFGMFLVKYNASGTGQWVTRISGAIQLGNIAYGVVSDTSDNVYVVASAFDRDEPFPMTVYNAGGTTFTTLTITTDPGACVVKYNSSGFAQWAVGLNSRITLFAICRDINTNLFLGGGTEALPNKALLGPSGTVAMTLPNGGLTDAMIVKYTTNGSPRWATRISSTGGDNAYGVTTDSLGNIYVVGQVGLGVATVYNADGTAFATTIPSVRGFLVKYNPDGLVQWVATYSATNTNNPGTLFGGRRVVLDSTGSIYIAAILNLSSSGTLITAYNADGSIGVTQSRVGTSSLTAVLFKYSSTGTAQWFAQMTSTSTNQFNGIAIGPGDTIHVGGYKGGSSTVLNSDGTTFATLAGGANAVAIKYNSSGIAQWAVRIGVASGTGGSGGEDIACDSSGNVYLLGEGGSTTVSTPIYNANGTTFATLPVTGGGSDGFLVKYNSSGVGQWSARFASTDPDIAAALVVDSAGDLYLTGYNGVTGSTAQTTLFSSDGTAPLATMTKSPVLGFLAKYSSAGIVQWQAALGRSSTVGAGDYPWAVAVDRRGNVYTGGLISSGGQSVRITHPTGSVSGPLTVPLNAIKFTSYGDVAWYQTIIGTLGVDRSGSMPTTYGLATDPDCNLILVGISARGDTTNIYAKA